VTFSSSQDPKTSPPLFPAQQLAAQEGSESNQSSRYYPGSVEFSAPLETSIPLEAPRAIYASPQSHQPVVAEPVKAAIAVPLVDPLESNLQTRADLKPSPEPGSETVPPSATFAAETSTPVAAEEKFQLLAERLVVDLHRRKVGEVVVRKEVETRIIEIPVRREKLIVEQINPDYQQLAIVDLSGSSETEFMAQDLVQIQTEPMVRGTFSSPQSAIQFLEAIAADSGLHPQAIQISIIPQDSCSTAIYESLLNQPS
jgi:hypothetical protein